MLNKLRKKYSYTLSKLEDYITILFFNFMIVYLVLAILFTFYIFIQYLTGTLPVVDVLGVSHECEK